MKQEMWFAILDDEGDIDFLYPDARTAVEEAEGKGVYLATVTLEPSKPIVPGKGETNESD